MWALDVGNQPAFGSLHQNEIQGNRAAFVVEGGGDISLVELLTQDRYRNRADFSGRALHKKIVRLIPRSAPRSAQALVEELARRGGIARQPAGKTGRPVAIIGVDVAHQRFRRAEPGPGGARTENGQENQ